MLFLAPVVEPVTLTAMVQDPPAAIVPPLKFKVVSLALGANVPPQEVEAPGVEATANPDGSASVKPTPRS